jgi:hypothetical protein|nr:MAG TPA: Major capsid protein [Caudoviricetes sp.]
MSIASFKKSIWETALITAFRKSSVAEIITTPPSSIEGEKAIFNVVAGGTVKDYTGSVDYDDAATDPIELNFNKKKYWALKLDDVDRIQAAGDILTQTANEKALDLKEAIDSDILNSMATVATSENKQLITKTITTPEEAYDAVVDLATILDVAKVPNTNRYLNASSSFVNLMAKDKRFADNYNILPNGMLDGANVAGFTIFKNEEVPNLKVVANYKGAYAFAKQLDETEPLRLEGSFSDAVRGLVNYGHVAIRPKGIAVLEYTLG